MKSSRLRYQLPLPGTRGPGCPPGAKWVTRTFCGWTLLLLAARSAVPAATVPAYRIEDLSAYGSDAGSQATAINAAGQVTCLVSSPGTNATSAFLWDAGAIWNLGANDGESIRANGLNSGSQVVGEAMTPGGQSAAFLWTNGVIRSLGTLGGDHSAAFGINDAGQVAGTTTLAGNQEWHAFRWQDGALQDLGTLGGRSSWGFGINEGGEVAGDSTTAGERALHAFRWSSGAMQDLGTLGGSRSLALAINRGGQVVGWSDAPGNGGIHAFRWNDGSMQDLGTLGGTRSFAQAINDAGAVVGSSTTAGDQDSRAFLFTDAAGMVDLNSRIDPNAGWELLQATGINAAGQIVGVGQHLGQTRGFRLTPLD